MRKLRQLRKLWVDELGMRRNSFQQAIEKMMSFKIRWIGGMTHEGTLFAKVLTSVTLCTSEYGGQVVAHVFLGGTGRTGKIPFLCKGRLFLALYEAEYTVVVEYIYLNVLDLIFWMDNEKCNVSDLGENVNVGDFL